MLVAGDYAGVAEFQPPSMVAKIVAGEFSCRGIPLAALGPAGKAGGTSTRVLFSGVSRVALLAYLSF